MDEKELELIRRELQSFAPSGRIPTNSENLFESGFLDSLTFMKLLIVFEQKLGVNFERDELRVENFKSIDAIMNLTMQKRARSKGKPEL